MKGSSYRRKIDIKSIKDGLLSKMRVTVHEGERFFFFFFLIESWVERSMTRRIKENVTENTVGLARECTPTNRWKNTSRSVLIKKQLDDQTIFYFRKFIQLFRGKNKNFLFFFPIVALELRRYKTIFQYWKYIQKFP